MIRAQSNESWDDWITQLKDILHPSSQTTYKTEVLMLKAEAFPVVAYDELCQTTLRFMENNALADIEDEILNKACIGGNCED
jgi:hypothetical protein